MRCVIVVPTYDEATSIGALLDGLAGVRASLEGVDLDVLVVDDSSPDGTADVVRAHAGSGEWVLLLSRASKDGLGAANRAGFAAAVRARYDVVVQMDADGSHPAAAVPALLDLLRTHDVVIGSRYVAGGATAGWPLTRRLLSRCANTYARSVLRLRTHDATSGFRAWRVQALVGAGVLGTRSHGYAFQVENTWRSERRGLRVAEHPITFTERTAGASKMNAQVAREAALLVLRWRVTELTRRTALAVARSTDRLERAVVR
jgi:dolichol-phosphate mannosyltransferase